MKQTFKIEGSTIKAPSTFWLVPKTIYKPVLQYPCKLNPAEPAIISIIIQKYSLVRKGPGNNQYITSNLSYLIIERDISFSP